MKKSNMATWTGRILLLFALLTMAAGPVIFYRYSQFLNRVKQLKADGVLVSLDDIVHQVPDPQDDALNYLKECFPVAKELVKLIDSDRLHRPVIKPDSIDEFERLLAQHPGFFEDFSKAAAAPDISSSFHGSEELVYSVLDLQNVLMVMSWKGHDLLACGEEAGAVEVAMEILQLSKQIKISSLLDAMICNVFQMIAFNLMYESLMTGKLDEDALTIIKEELASLELDNLYRNGLCSELSLALSQISSNADTKVRYFTKSWLTPVFLAFNGNQLLDQYELGIERSKLPLTQQFPDTPNVLFHRLTLSTDQTNYFNFLRNRFGHTKVQRQCLFILMALISDENSVDRVDWSPEYLENIGVARSDIVDPFNNLPMKILRQNNRWVIYSVGQNQQDDSRGRLSDDVGLGWLEVEQ